MKSVFLTANWRQLVMLNFEVDPKVLQYYVPYGTELDDWNGSTFISLVGFLFQDTNLKGIPIPFHRNFEEINLRFYVRTPHNDGWRRGVVFIREVVPHWAIATGARWLYNENYISCPTRSTVENPTESKPGLAVYGWKHQDNWLTIGATYSGEPIYPASESVEEFITEHYWGYSSLRNGGCMEYQVEHPKWRIWPASRILFEGKFGEFYGRKFSAILASKPASAFVADGSQVVVRGGELLERSRN
jgi:uncharacterized protein YqjF (DUF2071 family)